MAVVPVLPARPVLPSSSQSLCRSCRHKGRIARTPSSLTLKSRVVNLFRLHYRVLANNNVKLHYFVTILTDNFTR